MGRAKALHYIALHYIALHYMCLPGEVAQITGTISAKYTKRQCVHNHVNEYRYFVSACLKCIIGQLRLYLLKPTGLVYGDDRDNRGIEGAY